MAMHSIGDLAKTFVTRSQIRTLKADLADASTQLTTGKQNDLGRALGPRRHDYMELKTQIARKSAFHSVAQGGQRALETSLAYVARASDVMTALNTDVTAHLGANRLGRVGPAAKDALEQLVSLANSKDGESFAFGGYGRTPPLPAADDLLSLARLAIDPSLDPATVTAKLEQWFANPAGFDSVLELGAPRTVRTETGEIAVGVDAKELKSALMATLRIALTSELATDLTADDAMTFVADTKQSATYLTTVGGRLGTNLQKLEQYSVSTNAQIQTLRLHVTDLESVDQFEAATRFQHLETQLETSFAITARLSRLSLADYI